MLAIIVSAARSLTCRDIHVYIAERILFVVLSKIIFDKIFSMLHFRAIVTGVACLTDLSKVGRL